MPKQKVARSMDTDIAGESFRDQVVPGGRKRLPRLRGQDTAVIGGGDLFDSFENLVTSPEGFGLVGPSPLQRAVLRAYDGIDLELPLHGVVPWADPDVRAAFGGQKPDRGRIYREILIASGIRVGKTLFAAAGAVYQSQHCSFEHTEGHALLAGEIPRISVVSLHKDVAGPVLNHLIGTVQTRPRLAAMLAERPTADTVMLRHPTGRVVEIKVVAGARAGATLLGRWSAGVIFDEAPRMVGAAEGVVNLIEMQDAVLGRLLQGSRVWYIGSPYQPSGPIYDMVNEQWGKAKSDVLVIKAPAWVMNPVTWTPSVIAEFRKRKPHAARTDVDAEFADPETALFSQDVIVRVTRKQAALPYEPGNNYIAAMDPASRDNAWTLVIVTREDGKIKVAFAAEWRGSKASPLSVQDTVREIADCLRMYGLSHVKTDQWMADAIRDFAAPFGIGICQERWNDTEEVRNYTSLARRMEAGMVELPPIEQMRVDLLGIRRKVTASGPKIHKPLTSDGRHCDFAPALVLAASAWIEEPIFTPVDPDPEPEDERAERVAIARYEATVLDSGGLAADDYEDEPDMLDLY